MEVEEIAGAHDGEARRRELEDHEACAGLERPVDLGQCLPGNIDNVADVLALSEGDSYK